MIEIKLRDKKIHMLTKSDDLAYELSGLGNVIPASTRLQFFLEGLSEKYHLEKRMLAGNIWNRIGWSHRFGDVTNP